MSIGIIGAGSFGLFLAEKLSEVADVKVYSRSGKGGKWNASLEAVAACDWVIPCIPLDAYTSVLTELKPLLSPQTILVDVCSVKEKPIQAIKEVLPDQQLVATHPLFGPESASESLVGHTVVLCPESSDKTAYDAVKTLCQQLELVIVEMSALEHDKEMAVVQGLTFFIAHALKDMNLHKMVLETPSFKRLRHLGELEEHHSQELFETIQNGNPQTRDVREAFLRHAASINASLES